MNQESPYKLRKKLKRRRLIVAIIIVVPLLGFILFSTRGVVARIGLEMQKKTMQEEISAARMQQDSLRNAIKQLQSDTLLIERLARERYGMMKPGETVYQIETQQRK